MKKAIRISAVSYLNTKPLLFGLVKSGLSNQIEIHLDIPSVCAQKLKSGEVDLGLVPVAILPELEHAEIVTDYCIGSEGPVGTVGIFSERPLGELKRIFLDFHSRTSVELGKYLLANYWKIDVELLPAFPGFEEQIAGETGGLIIGDRAITYASRFPYFYDFGEAWTIHTGLPFVFAAWVSTRPVPAEFLEELNTAFAAGLADLPQLMYLLPSPSPSFDLEEYYRKNISYLLDQPKREALDKFLGILAEAKKKPVRLLEE